MINRYRDKHILEMCMDMVYVCVHKDVCWLSGFVVCLSAMRKREGGGGELCEFQTNGKKKYLQLHVCESGSIDTTPNLFRRS